MIEKEHSTLYNAAKFIVWFIDAVVAVVAVFPWLENATGVSKRLFYCSFSSSSSSSSSNMSVRVCTSVLVYCVCVVHVWSGCVIDIIMHIFDCDLVVVHVCLCASEVHCMSGELRLFLIV